MTLSLADRITHFETHADEIANILRGYMRRWGAAEQLEDDPPTDERTRRAFIGYRYPTEPEPGFVAMTLWIGGTGTMHIEDEGRVLRMEHAPTDYLCAQIAIAALPRHGDDWLIDNEHRVHSVGELKDRLTVMWNADHWTTRHPHVEDNAEKYPAFAARRARFDATFKGVGKLLAKLGAAAGADLQTNNDPEPEDAAGGGMLGGLLGGGSKGPRRAFVGYARPLWRLDPEGRARPTPAHVTLDVWNGPKGTIHSTTGRRKIDLTSPANHTQLRVEVHADSLRVPSAGVAAPDVKTLSSKLAAWYKSGDHTLNG